MSEVSDDHFTITTTVQISGILLKRPFGHLSKSKWSKRFFIIKDGFLFYYPESEKKHFEKRGYFNMHPKGVVPLSNCTVDSRCEPPHYYVIQVISEEFSSGQILLAAENPMEHDRWMRIIQESSRITWKNVQMGETLIKELETQGLQLCKERQNYFDKLQKETIALRNEIDKNEELEKITSELEKEKKRLEDFLFELQTEHTQTQREYDETVQTLRVLEEEKQHYNETTLMLQKTLEELARERENTLKLLRGNDGDPNSRVTSEELQAYLNDIEDETQQIMREKEDLEKRFLENQIHTQILEEERQIFSEQANQLLSNLNDLVAQKEVTEAELKEEVTARLHAEKRLKVAEQSLHHIDLALKKVGEKISDPLLDEIKPNVKNLKKFFEDVAEEANIDANKPIIMKNAILTRKACIHRSQTLRLKSTREQKVKFNTLRKNRENDSCALRRSQSVIVNNHAQQKLQHLKRALSTRTLSK